MKLEVKQEKRPIFEKKFGLEAKQRFLAKKKFQGEADLKQGKVAAKNKFQGEAKLRIWSRDLQLFPKISTKKLKIFLLASSALASALY